MSADVLDKVKRLPPEKQRQVEDFVDCLISKYVAVGEVASEKVHEQRRRAMGWAKGQIWMAPDFNETPEDFKDYL